MSPKKKYQLLFITRKYPPSVGGMENFCYELATGIDRNKFDVKIIALGKKQIHLLWFFPYVILYTLFCSRKYDAILVGDMLLCATGIFCHIVSPKTKRVVAVHGLDITFQNGLYQFYLKIFGKTSFDTYICNSQNTCQLLKEYLGISGEVIRLGVDIHKYRNMKRNRKKFSIQYGIPEDALILITVGRLVKRKGVSWFVQNVIPALDEKVIYAVIGDGADYEEIKAVVEKNHTKASVLLLGRVSDNMLADYYANADVFVMPNISVPGDIEGFGLVALEASLSENIVVASGIEGIKDAIVNGENGFLLESGNAKQYIQKIQDIQKHPDYYQTIAKAFADYTEAHYSWKNVCAAYEEILLQLLHE